MRLYLVRHGQAEPKDVDPQRGLTAKGRADSRRTAEFLATLDLSVAAVWHSTKKRARQTAEIVAPAFGAADRRVERDGLTPNALVGPVAEELNTLDEDLAIVGHMPFQSCLAAALLTGDDEGDWLDFSTAGVACLERDRDDGSWQLLWMIDPGLIGR
jgi:phosphohistidine phosphatase